MSSPSDTTSLSLGKRVATYFPNSHRYRLRLSVFVALSVLGGSLLYVVSGSPAYGRPHFVVAATLLGIGILGAARVWLRGTRAVHLHQLGVEFVDAASADVFLWEEISNVWQTPIYTDTKNRIGPQSWTMKIQSNDGRRLKLDGFEGAIAIVQRTQREIASRLFEPYRQAYDAGHWLRFGSKLAISDEGLKVNKKQISWYAVNDVFLDEEDGVRIGYGSDAIRWIHLPVKSVANFVLLGQLLGWVRSKQSLGVEQYEQHVSDERSVGLFDEKSDCDVNELVASGFEWDEIDDVINGECTVDELLARGPRKRPRVPK